ncbi:chitin disaccharide deacetylase [Thaumasiovibrio subtropicus]|uniref:chitin disaccharide deacetylase n=1 Tax=Thaumasiovibrio subtropicus TaxID=1891207 RepID=UPI000B3605AF|nr:chitin disaccharide deacetylase [Thaumasiovibrio subtropicus]
MQVIFNADDFGLTQGVNYGIADACRQGVVRSTTMMAGMAAFEHGIALAADVPDLQIGVHLRLTAGKPMTALSQGVNSEGEFLRDAERWTQSLTETEIGDELVAQIEAVRGAGIEISHLDSHHHAHMLPAVLPVAIAVAQQYKVPLRGNGHQGWHRAALRYQFSADFYDDALSEQCVLETIEQHRHDCDVIEFMCHPAYLDEGLLSRSAYAEPRAKELAILTSSRLRAAIEAQGHQLADYRVLW